MLWQAAHFLKTFSPSAAFVEANIAKIFPESEFVFEEVVLLEELPPRQLSFLLVQL